MTLRARVLTLASIFILTISSNFLKINYVKGHSHSAKAADRLCASAFEESSLQNALNSTAVRYLADNSLSFINLNEVLKTSPLYLYTARRISILWRTFFQFSDAKGVKDK